MARKSLSKTVRFEVFKRDRFTCQYCGAKAPEVVLHADHIHPVAEGGTNEILNLVTACAACNGGKGARLLDDRSAVERQRSQIEDLESRREQLEMMLAWRDSAQAAVVDVVEAVSERIGERGGYWPNENGKNDIRKWLKRYSLAEVLEALDEAFDRYMMFKDGAPDEAAWGVAFNKIPLLASYARKAADKPYLAKLAYIQGILRNRAGNPKLRALQALEEIHTEWGVGLEAMEAEAKVADGWEAFCMACEDRAGGQ